MVWTVVPGVPALYLCRKQSWEALASDSYVLGISHAKTAYKLVGCSNVRTHLLLEYL